MVTYNYNYGKVKDSQTVQYAPKILRLDGRTWVNPPSKVLLQAGYYPINLTAYPTDGADYVINYELVDGEISQTWKLISEVQDESIAKT